MIIKYDGQDYPFDLDDVTVKQAIKIEGYMGCPFAEWGKRLQAGEDMMARQALGWVILTGGDLKAEIGDTDFKLTALAKALDDAFTAEAAKEAAANPVPTVAAVASNGHEPPPESSPLSLPPSSDVI